MSEFTSPTTSASNSSNLQISDLVFALLDSARSAGISMTTAELTAGTGPYTLAQIHRAIFFTLRDFVRETRCTRQFSSLTLTASTATVSFSDITAFDPERIIGSGIRIVADSNYASSDSRVAAGIEVVGPEDLADAMLECGDGVGVPTLLAFDTFSVGFPSSATVWRTPEFTGSAKVEWSPPPIYYDGTVATGVTAGDAAISNYTFNVRDDLAEKAIRTGGVVYLQNGAIENVALTDRMKAAYVDHIRASSGRGNLGRKSIRRMSLHDVRSRRTGGL